MVNLISEGLEFHVVFPVSYFGVFLATHVVYMVSLRGLCVFVFHNLHISHIYCFFFTRFFLMEFFTVHEQAR